MATSPACPCLQRSMPQRMLNLSELAGTPNARITVTAPARAISFVLMVSCSSGMFVERRFGLIRGRVDGPESGLDWGRPHVRVGDPLDMSFRYSHHNDESRASRTSWKLRIPAAGVHALPVMWQRAPNG